MSLLHAGLGDDARKTICYSSPRKRPAAIVSIPSTTIAAVALEALVIAAKESIAVGLLVLIPTTVSTVIAIAAVTAVAIPVEMGSLRIVVLSALGVI